MSSTSSISFKPRIFQFTKNNILPKLDIVPIQPDIKSLNNSFSQNDTNTYIKSEKTYGLIRPL